MKMSQMFKFFLMAVLICILPLILSSALRPPYLYFLVNLLVIVLGAEAGLFSFISKTPYHHHHHQNKKTTSFSTHDHTNLAQTPTNPTPKASCNENPATTVAGNARIDEESIKTDKVVEKSPSMKNPATTAAGNAKIDEESTKTNKVVEKSASMKVNHVTAFSMLHKGLKRSPTSPSLFFIAGGADDLDHHEEEDDRHDKIEDHQEDDDNSNELFNKAETFIGNFYKQLKMQREESWNNMQTLIKNI